MPLLILVGAEATLRLLGTGYDADFLVPVDEQPGYMVDNYRFAWRFFPKALARTPQPIDVTKAKPAGTIRIVIFGGSAAMGDPEAAFGMPRVLERLLADRFPQHSFEIINAAVTAINSHVVLSIAADCRCLDADAWVIYMGNNEVHGPFGAGTVFTDTETPRWLIRSGLALRKTRLGQLVSGGNGSSPGAPESWGGMKMFLDHQIRHDSPALDRVYQNYQKNIEALLAMARRSGVRPIVSTVVTNLRDFPPFVSQHGDGISQARLQQWQRAFDQGCQQQASGRFEDALRSFQSAAAIDDEYAELAFRTAECLTRRRQANQAYDAFVRARDLDALRFRADSKINSIIRAVATARADVGFVDAALEFTRLGDTGVPGEDLLYEHVHLNMAGNYALARLMGDELIETLDLREGGPNAVGKTGWPTMEACAAAIGLSPFHQMTVLQEVKGRLSVPPFDSQVFQEERMHRLDREIATFRNKMTGEAKQRTIAQYDRLIADRPDDWYLRWQYASMLESIGDLQSAVVHQKKVTELLPHYPQGFFSVGTLLNRLKSYGEAAQFLRTAIALRPDFSQAYNSLGIALSHRENPDDAIAQFKKAVELRPKFADAHLNWGLVLLHQGHQDAALDQFLAAVKANPNLLAAHIRLAKHFLDAQEYQAALPHYQAIARLRPNNVESAINLAMLYVKLDNRTAAIDQLKQALLIDPDNGPARQALRQLNAPRSALEPASTSESTTEPESDRQPESQTLELSP